MENLKLSIMIYDNMKWKERICNPTIILWDQADNNDYDDH